MHEIGLKSGNGKYRQVRHWRARLDFAAPEPPMKGDTVRVDMSQLKIPVSEERIRDFCRKWRIVELSIFGSALREDFHLDSDVDVLVSFAKDAPWSLYDWVDMIRELRDVFGRDVDLLSTQALRNPFRRHEILRSRARVYAASGKGSLTRLPCLGPICR